MSLISEALQKAQRERELQASDHDGHKPRYRSSRRFSPALLILTVSVLLFGAALALFLQSRREPMPPQPAMTVQNFPVEQAEAIPAELRADQTTSSDQQMPAEATEPEKKPDALVKPGSHRHNDQARKVDPPPAPRSYRPEPAAEPLVARRETDGPDWRLRLEEADRLQKSGRNLEAIEQLRLALARQRQPEIYSRLAALLTAEANHSLALDYLEEALQTYPDNYDLRKAAVASAIRARAFDRGLLHLDRALQLEPRDPALHTYLGLCRFHNRDFHAARDSFQRSLSLQPTGHHNIYYLGLIEDNLRNHREALRLYRLFLERNDPAADFRHRDWLQQRIRTIEDFLASE